MSNGTILDGFSQGDPPVKNENEAGTLGTKRGGVLTLIGIGATALMSIWGASKEEEQQDKLLKMQQKESDKAYGLQQQQLGLNRQKIGLNRQELAFQKKEAKRKWRWMEEDRNYQRASDFTNRFTGMLDRNQQFKNNLVNMWGKKVL